MDRPQIINTIQASEKPIFFSHAVLCDFDSFNLTTVAIVEGYFGAGFTNFGRIVPIPSVIQNKNHKRWFTIMLKMIQIKGPIFSTSSDTPILTVPVLGSSIIAIFVLH